MSYRATDQTGGIILVPEPMSTYSGEPVFPRKRGENCVPAAYLSDLGLSRDDAEYAERAWVRPVQPPDLDDDSFACEWPGETCGNGCGCWIITTAKDPRRQQPIWWLP